MTTPPDFNRTTSPARAVHASPTRASTGAAETRAADALSGWIDWLML
jgi:hypothetical protein